MKKFPGLSAVFLILASVTFASAHAQELPLKLSLWETGIGAAGISFPD